ncbi:lactonase family protein [Novosphingobium terrae]|uniref:lactonase family protein n=1 Tax=Novosphingobium terrae TaxID=2726189 RepID=UPI001981BD14|nr:lactonase family protein [Novosphingobium terrae]
MGNFWKITVSGLGMMLAMAGPAVARPAAAPTSEIVYFGQHGTDITAARFDRRTGDLTLIGPVASPGRPTWAVMHPRLPVLYVANELGNDGKTNGMVIAYRVDEKSGKLTQISQVDAGGGGTTHLSLDPKSMTITAANYGGGSLTTIGIEKDGSLGPLASLTVEKGSGPHKRQKSAHAHSAMIAPGGHFALVADLGTDRVYVYPFDPATHKAREAQPGEAQDFVAPAGSGPRHMAASGDGRFVYLLDELVADVATLAWDARAGKLTEVDRQSISSPDLKGEGSGSEIATSADGRFLYIGNRAESFLQVYTLDKASGKPTLIQRVPTGGSYPWGFGISPDGRWMLVAHEQSDDVAVLKIDPATGKVSDTGHHLKMSHPVSVTFAAHR